MPIAPSSVKSLAIWDVYYILYSFLIVRSLTKTSKMGVRTSACYCYSFPESMSLIILVNHPFSSVITVTAIETDPIQIIETVCRLILCSKDILIRSVLRFHLEVCKQNLLNMNVDHHRFIKFEDYINNKVASLVYFKPRYFCASIPSIFIVSNSQIK